MLQRCRLLINRAFESSPYTTVYIAIMLLSLMAVINTVVVGFSAISNIFNGALDTALLQAVDIGTLILMPVSFTTVCIEFIQFDAKESRLDISQRERFITVFRKRWVVFVCALGVPSLNVLIQRSSGG